MFEIDFSTNDDKIIIQQASQKLSAPVDDWEKQVWQFVANWFNPVVETITVSTSGSTGAPKQIAHSKQAMLNSAGLTCTALNLQTGNTALLCLPVTKIAGMMMVVRSIHQKMKLVCIKPSTEPFNDIPDNQQINFAAFTPMQFYSITGNAESLKKAAQIDKIILGGEDVRAELLHYIQQLPNKVYITFGMTETISHIALKKLNGQKPDANFITMPGISISTDTRNCLVIEAPLLAQPHLVTNDVVEIISLNQFKWLGRFDNVINTGGIKIYPEEIEQQLLNGIEVPFFITSKPDEHTGQKLVLVMEKDTLTDNEKEALKKALSTLEKLHRPKEVMLINQFERTANGKIQRKQTLLNSGQTTML